MPKPSRLSYIVISNTIRFVPDREKKDIAMLDVDYRDPPNRIHYIIYKFQGTTKIAVYLNYRVGLISQLDLIIDLWPLGFYTYIRLRRPPTSVRQRGSGASLQSNFENKRDYDVSRRERG